MAGYFLYSLDWAKLQKLVQKPTKAQLTVLAKAVLLERQLSENSRYEVHPDDLIQNWPTEVNALAPRIAERLALPDWYSDLTEKGKDVWSGAFARACHYSKGLAVGYQPAESDGVSSEVIESICAELGVPSYRERIAGKAPPVTTAMARFGRAPFRCPLAAIREGGNPFNEEEPLDWFPTHSMHPPEEVKQMVAEIHSVAKAVISKANKWERLQFEQDFLPYLEQMAEEGRVVMVSVDM